MDFCLLQPLSCYFSQRAKGRCRGIHKIKTSSSLPRATKRSRRSLLFFLSQSRQGWSHAHLTISTTFLQIFLFVLLSMCDNTFICYSRNAELSPRASQCHILTLMRLKVPKVDRKAWFFSYLELENLEQSVLRVLYRDEFESWLEWRISRFVPEWEYIYWRTWLELSCRAVWGVYTASVKYHICKIFGYFDLVWLHWTSWLPRVPSCRPTTKHQLHSHHHNPEPHFLQVQTNMNQFQRQVKGHRLITPHIHNPPPPFPITTTNNTSIQTSTSTCPTEPSRTKQISTNTRAKPPRVHYWPRFPHPPNELPTFIRTNSIHRRRMTNWNMNLSRSYQRTKRIRRIGQRRTNGIVPWW